MPEVLGTLTIERVLTLCFRDNSQEAWHEFVVRTQPIVARVVVGVLHRCGVRDYGLAEELVQTTFVKMTKTRHLAEFKANHPNSLEAYLRVMAANVVHDHFRDQKRMRRGGEWERMEMTDEIASTERSHAGRAREEDEILLQQIEQCVGEFVPGPEVDRNLLILQLHFRVGLSASTIATIPSLGLTEKGVEGLLNRVVREARVRLAQEERRALERTAARREIASDGV